MYRRCCQERESARHGGIYEYGVGGELAIDPDATWDEVEAGVHLVADDHGHGARVGHVDGLDGERDPLVHARRRRRGGLADAREAVGLVCHCGRLKRDQRREQRHHQGRETSLAVDRIELLGRPQMPTTRTVNHESSCCLSWESPTRQRKGHRKGGARPSRTTPSLTALGNHQD